VADLEDAVARGDAGQGDEADQCATDSGCPEIHSAMTLPTSASGMLPMMIRVSAVER
jgi:hypothetical protein